MKKHLITGVTGQDGLFLVKKILESEENPKILGISRSKSEENFFKNLNRLGVNKSEKIKLVNLDLTNYFEVENFLRKFTPDFIYNLTGPSSPNESIQNPDKYRQIELIFQNLTSALVSINLYPNFFQASTSEMFKNNDRNKLNELSDFSPNSQYALSKLINHKKVKQLRNRHNWKIFSGIMFNHESEFRKENYLFKKVINSALNIKNNKLEYLEIGSLDYIRDWSFAGDISDAIYEITKNGKSDSYVIGSGKGHTINDLITYVFNYFQLDVHEKILLNSNLLRSGDPKYIVSDPSKIKNELGWSATLNFYETILRCIKLK